MKHITENRCRNYKCNPTFKSPRSQHVYDEETSMRDFAIACVKHNYPFNMGEHEYFEAYIKGINPYVKLPSRNTIKSDVLELYKAEKARVYKQLDNLDCNVSLTTVLWTSDHSGKPYCCVTAHYIDDSWELHKIVLAFKLLPYSHDADIILETALPLRDAFEHFALSNETYRRYNPSAQEWENANVVLECLRTFYEATKIFSGSKYATSNIFFPIVCEVKLKLVEMENSEHEILRQMCSPMNAKFDKYWDECKSVLSVAAVFDPRCKMHVIRYFFTQLYDDDGEAEEHIGMVQRSLDDIYISYGGTHVPSGTASSSSRVSERKGYLYRFSDWYDASHECSVQNELEMYLKEPILPPQEDLDILKWWSISCKRLPILHKIARDLLAISATTVASESTFSVGGRIIDEERSLLGPQVVEALITVKDWIPPINKISRQSMPIIGEEVFESRSEEVDEVED